MPNKFLALAGAAVVAALLAGCVTKVIQAPPSNNFAASAAKQQPNAYFGQRHALVIGNANYAVGPLRNPLNDASDMAAALEGLGFEVQRLLDADASAMERAIIDFNKRLSSGGVGLFYYAGHGIQAQGSNYLIPLRAGISSELQLKHKAISAGFVLDAMEAANKGVNIVILDACRDNPYESSFRSNDRGLVPMNGLAPMNSPKGSLIAYATAPGGIAADGEERNGLFTQHLLAAMQQPNQLVELTFKDVAKAVSDHSGGQQTPFVTSSLTEYFYFNPSAEAPPTPAPSGTFTTSAATNPAPTNKFTPSSIDGLSLDEWLLVHGNEPKTLANLDKVAAYQSQHGGNAASRSYIDSGLTELLATGVDRGELIRLKKRFPTSATLRLQLADEFHHSSLFEAALAEYQSWLDLTDGKHPEHKQVQLAMAAAQKGHLFAVQDCPECPQMVYIPAGTFPMGDIQGGGQSDEKPVHRVSVKAFLMSQTEVTFAEWDACVATGGCSHKPSDSGWGRGSRPVINISWEDITKQYIPWLNKTTGAQYRLPSEAEWEYAARAGSETKYSWGNTAGHDYANYGTDNCCGSLAKGKDRWEYTSPVASFAANAFGLYDMHGNVWEWTLDCWNGSYKGAPSDGTAWLSGNCSRRVLRGGSWFNIPVILRSANRDSNSTGNRNYFIGFRLARALD